MNGGKLSVVNARTESRRQNELGGKFKMVASDLVSVRGQIINLVIFHVKIMMTWRRLYCLFTCIYTLLIEKDICDCRNISVKLPCVNMCISSRDLFIISESFLFLFLFY